MADQQLTDEELAEIEQRADAATEPVGAKRWHVEGDQHRWDVYSGRDFTTGKTEDIAVGFFHEADARFVAHARTDVPRLVDELRASRAREAAFKARCRDHFEQAERFRAERDVLQQRIDAALALHSPDVERFTMPDGSRMIAADEIPCKGCATVATFTPISRCRTRAALTGPNPTAAPPAAAVDGRTPPRTGGDTGLDGTGQLRAAPGYEGGPDRSEW